MKITRVEPIFVGFPTITARRSRRARHGGLGHAGHSLRAGRDRCRHHRLGRGIQPCLDAGDHHGDLRDRRQARGRPRPDRHLRADGRSHAHAPRAWRAAGRSSSRCPGSISRCGTSPARSRASRCGSCSAARSARTRPGLRQPVSARHARACRASVARKAVERGYRHVKLHEHSVETVAAARAAIGPGCVADGRHQLLSGTSPTTSSRSASELEPYDVDLARGAALSGRRPTTGWRGSAARCACRSPPARISATSTTCAGSSDRRRRHRAAERRQDRRHHRDAEGDGLCREQGQLAPCRIRPSSARRWSRPSMSSRRCRRDVVASIASAISRRARSAIASCRETAAGRAGRAGPRLRGRSGRDREISCRVRQDHAAFRWNHLNADNVIDFGIT